MTAQPPFSPHHFHRLTNTSNPSSPKLDVVNDAGTQNSAGLLKLTREGYYSGQYWSFTPSHAPYCPPQVSEQRTDNPTTSNTYRLRTWWLGPNRQLDVYADDTSKAVPRRHDNTAHALDRRIGEWGMVLDVRDRPDGSEVMLKERDKGRITQRWRVEVIREIGEQEYEDRPATPTL